MAEQLTISQILTVAKVSQYLASQDVANSSAFKGGNIENNIPRIIYMERIGIQKRYDLNPDDSTLRDTANYLFALLGKYARQGLIRLSQLMATPPVVTGPSNQSVNVNTNATFTISVTSGLPFTIQWFKDGVLIPGATGLSYVVTSAQLADSGSTYSAIATSPAGATNSAVGTLTVSANITGSYWYGSDDPYPDLSMGVDNLTYQGTFNITNGNPLVVPFPIAASNNLYNVTRYPNTQSSKTVWNNTVSNNGVIPDSTYRSIITIGSNLYIVSRVAMSLDSTSPTTTYS